MSFPFLLRKAGLSLLMVLPFLIKSFVIIPRGRPRSSPEQNIPNLNECDSAQAVLRESSRCDACPVKISAQHGCSFSACRAAHSISLWQEWGVLSTACRFLSTTSSPVRWSNVWHPDSLRDRIMDAVDILAARFISAPVLLHAVQYLCLEKYGPVPPAKNTMPSSKKRTWSLEASVRCRQQSHHSCRSRAPGLETYKRFMTVASMPIWSDLTRSISSPGGAPDVALDDTDRCPAYSTRDQAAILRSPLIVQLHAFFVAHIAVVSPASASPEVSV